jgi:putative oxidoreductase
VFKHSFVEDSAMEGSMNWRAQATGARRGSLARRLTRKLMRTDADWTATIARVALGLVILPHGLQKTLGLFGGYGVTGTLGYLTGTVGLPTLIAGLVILAESAGAIGLVLGALGRIAALGVGAVMVGAIVSVHWANGFFMNWAGTKAGEGFEYHLLALALVAIVLRTGSGAASLDRVAAARLR